MYINTHTCIRTHMFHMHMCMWVCVCIRVISIGLGIGICRCMGVGVGIPYNVKFIMYDVSYVIFMHM